MPVTPSPLKHPPCTLEAECRGLPDPVARYLRATLGGESRPITSVEMKQVGTLRNDAGAQRWLSFRADHRVRPQIRQFEWDARVRLAPLVLLRVRDAYADGVGQGQVHLWSYLRLAADHDVPELNAGALHRFLAEAAWYPSALLPSAGVCWSPIDEARALATLEDSGISVSLEFRFSAAGDIESVYTPGRWRRVSGVYRPCAWEGRFSDHRSTGGLRLPFCAEVGWYADGELGIVWRGEVTTIRHHFAPCAA
jgi:hypothetical protein